MNAFIGQLLLVPYNFAPSGWLFCQGQLLSISENDALFQLIGTTYGGDGQSTFGLPNLQGRTPIGVGQGPGRQNYTIGEAAGVENVTLGINQIPAHTHPFAATNTAGNNVHPQNATFAAGVSSYENVFGTDTTLAPAVCSPVGGSQPHTNLQPFLTLNWIISLFGIFPSQN